MLALLVGFATPVLGWKYAIMLFGASLAPALLFITSELILFIMLFFGLILDGVFEYFFNIVIHWSVYILGLVGYFICLVAATRNDPKSLQNVIGRGVSLPIIFFILFIVCLTISTINARPGLYHLIISIRDYFFLMSAYLIVVRIKLNDEFLKRLWRFLYFCALVQLPFILYQFLFIARNRLDATRWDAIVGTFIGTKSGGGDSGGLTIFLFSVLVLSIELRKSGAVSKGNLLTILLTIITFVAVAEVKVAFVLLSLIAIWNLVGAKKVSLFIRLATFSGFMVFFIGLTWFYDEFRQDTSSTQAKTAEERLEKTLRYTIDPTLVDQSNTVGRIASVVLWGTKNSVARDPLSFFIGNGAGSIVMTREGLGMIAKKYYPLRMDINAVTVLLWDSGLVGAISYGFFVLLILRNAISSRNDETSSIWLNGYLAAIPQILFFYCLSLFYNKGMIANSPATQLIFFVFAALASQWSAQKQKIVFKG